MDTDLEISGRAIRNTRLRRGMSVAELAEKAGMAAKTVYDIERGSATRITTVRKVAAALDVEIAELLAPVPGPAGEGAA